MSVSAQTNYTLSKAQKMRLRRQTKTASYGRPIGFFVSLPFDYYPNWFLFRSLGCFDSRIASKSSVKDAQDIKATLGRNW